MSEKLITDQTEFERIRGKVLTFEKIKNANATPAHCPLDMKSQFASLCPTTERNFIRYYSRYDNWVLRTENEEIK